ncbi:MAG: hypothetical protein WKI04_09175 [Ferruginibacter sp.]
MEILSFHANIPGKPTYPIQFIMEEIDDYSCNQQKDCHDNDPFTGIAAHGVKLVHDDKVRYKKK